MALAAIVSVLLVSVTMVLTTPASGQPQMTVAQAAAALSGTSTPGLRSRRVASPISGRSSELLRSTLARAMRVPSDRLRAVWLETPVAIEAQPSVQTVTLLAGQEAVVEAREGGFTLFSGSAARLRPDTPVPPFAAALRLGDGEWLTVAPQEPLLTPWRWRLILAFAASALLLVPFVFLVARQLTRPIRSLAQAAETMRLGSVSHPVPLAGPEEVREAARALNAMRDRLLSELSRRTTMLAAIAHDLRNPLTGLRMRADAAPEPERSRMIADIQRMSSMIAQVLDYVRGGEAQTAMTVCDAASMVRTWTAGLDQQSELRFGPLRPRQMVLCNADALRRAVTNLVDNAIRFAGGAELSVAPDGEWVAISVQDDGPGIDPGEVHRLLEPFERLETSRSADTGGVGLGLAICREIVETHRGRLDLSPRIPSGLVATIRLPRIRVEGDPASSESVEGDGGECLSS